MYEREILLQTHFHLSYPLRFIYKVDIEWRLVKSVKVKAHKCSLKKKNSFTTLKRLEWNTFYVHICCLRAFHLVICFNHTRAFTWVEFQMTLGSVMLHKTLCILVHLQETMFYCGSEEHPCCPQEIWRSQGTLGLTSLRVSI